MRRAKPDRSDKGVTLNHCATVLGITWSQAERALHKVQWAYPPIKGRYDPRVLDLLRALRGQPHRALEPVHQDWLARYLKESHDSPEPPRPPAARADADR